MNITDSTTAQHSITNRVYTMLAAGALTVGLLSAGVLAGSNPTTDTTLRGTQVALATMTFPAGAIVRPEPSFCMLGKYSGRKRGCRGGGTWNGPVKTGAKCVIGGGGGAIIGATKGGVYGAAAGAAIGCVAAS